MSSGKAARLLDDGACMRKEDAAGREVVWNAFEVARHVATVIPSTCLLNFIFKCDDLCLLSYASAAADLIFMSCAGGRLAVLGNFAVLCSSLCGGK